MVDKKGTQQSSGEGTTTIPSQNFQRITAMLKTKSVSEWKGQHPSFENFPVLAADNSKTGGKKGDDTQQKVMARYVASNTDKIIGRQMAADTVIVQRGKQAALGHESGFKFPNF